MQWSHFPDTWCHGFQCPGSVMLRLPAVTRALSGVAPSKGFAAATSNGMFPLLYIYLYGRF